MKTERDPHVLITVVQFQLPFFFLLLFFRHASYITRFPTLGGRSCHMNRSGFVRQMFWGGTASLDIWTLRKVVLDARSSGSFSKRERRRRRRRTQCSWSKCRRTALERTVGGNRIAFMWAEPTGCCQSAKVSELVTLVSKFSLVWKEWNFFFFFFLVKKKLQFSFEQTKPNENTSKSLGAKK